MGGASAEEIREAQQSLGCVFPEDYRHFLAGYGAGNFCACEIYGIIPQKELCRIPNGIWATGYLRQRYQMPATCIAVAFDGYGGYYCIDTAQTGADKLCPVVLWNMEGENGAEPERIADSFEEFFLTCLKAEIDRLL